MGSICSNCSKFLATPCTFHKGHNIRRNTWGSTSDLINTWGSLIYPNLWWKSQFGSVNLYFFKIRFLPFYGLWATFMGKKKKKVFLDYQLFFSGTKNFFPRNNFWFSFLCIVKQKKIWSDSKIFEKSYFLGIY